MILIMAVVLCMLGLSRVRLNVKLLKHHQPRPRSEKREVDGGWRTAGLNVRSVWLRQEEPADILST